MTDPHQHRATPEQWKHLENGAQLERPYNSALCLLELRDRIAALEAAQANQFRGATEKVPAGSLVERVEKAVYDKRTLDDLVRTAILEVAAWLRERSEWVGSDMLEQEAANG